MEVMVVVVVEVEAVVKLEVAMMGQLEVLVGKEEGQGKVMKVAVEADPLE
jgi:hypothetical protein